MQALLSIFAGVASAFVGNALLALFMAEISMNDAMLKAMLTAPIHCVMVLVAWIISRLIHRSSSRKLSRASTGTASLAPPQAIKSNESDDCSSDEDLWKLALEEFEGPTRRQGLWAKAYAAADGDESRAKANYLSLRVSSLAREKASTQYEVDQAEAESGAPTQIAGIEEDNSKLTVSATGVAEHPNASDDDVGWDPLGSPKGMFFFLLRLALGLIVILALMGGLLSVSS